MFIGEICSREVVVIDKDSSLQAAAILMRKYHVGDIVVVEERNGKRFPIGIMTDRDIIMEVVAMELDIKVFAVGDFMSKTLVLAEESEDLLPVIERMRTQGVSRIPIVAADDSLVGIVSTTDLINALSELLTALSSLTRRQQVREREQR